MPITNTQEEYEIRSISPVHINPSIMEGTQQFTSILGPSRAVEIVRFPPSFIVGALLTGDPSIPSWLECSPGVVDASPQAFRSYQWYANDVLIDGATNNRFLTSNIYDGDDLKCIVRAFNVLGEAFSESNEITATVVEPIFVQEADYYPITGLGALDNLTMINLNPMVLTGMSVPDHESIFGLSIYPIQGMANLDAIGVNYLDIYATQFHTLMRTFSLSNPGAEAGSSSGWTVVTGSFNSVLGPSKSGSRYFKSATQNVLCKITQTVTIGEAGDLAQIAAGNGFARVSYWATNDTEFSFNRSQMRVYLEALDTGGTVVGTLNQFGWVKPDLKTVSNLWFPYNYVVEPLPVTTTQVRIVIEFEAFNLLTGNSCNVDDISLELFRI